MRRSGCAGGNGSGAGFGGDYDYSSQDLRTGQAGGSIKEGKDADFVVYQGDPLELMNKPEMVICGGKIVYERK